MLDTAPPRPLQRSEEWVARNLSWPTTPEFHSEAGILFAQTALPRRDGSQPAGRGGCPPGRGASRSNACPKWRAACKQSLRQGSLRIVSRKPDIGTVGPRPGAHRVAEPVCASRIREVADSPAHLRIDRLDDVTGPAALHRVVLGVATIRLQSATREPSSGTCSGIPAMAGLAASRWVPGMETNLRTSPGTAVQGLRGPGSALPGRLRR